jgi:hypothetical protein
MDPRNFSPKTKRLAWKRCAGHCEKCTTNLTTGNIIYDHVIPWEISYDSSPENCCVTCKTCDASKTYGEDIPTIAKVHRIYDRAIGIERSGPKLPAGRNSGIRNGGWTCCVEQGHYGHASRKATWLYARGVDLPSLRWGSSGQRLDPKILERHGYEYARRCGVIAMIGGKDKSILRAATPPEFRDLLLSIAASAAVRSFAA